MKWRQSSNQLEPTGSFNVNYEIIQHDQANRLIRIKEL